MRIQFIPKPGTEYNVSGFPERLIGDGLIELELRYSFGSEAIYRDIFFEEYQIEDPAQGSWQIEIYED